MKKCTETPDSLRNKIKEKPQTPRIIHSGLGRLEGPVFLAGELWCVEMEEGNLLRFMEGNVHRIHIGGGPNGLTVGNDGFLYITDNLRQAVLAYDPEEHRLFTVVDTLDAGPCRKANDLAFDAEGTLVFTCPQWPAQDIDKGCIGWVRPDGSCGSFSEEFRFWNGLAFADGGRTLYVSDSTGSTLWKGGWDAENCRWIDPAPCKYYGKGLPDGMCLDTEERVYLALYLGGRVACYPSDGTQVSHLPTPGVRTTNCAFDPNCPGRMVITEMEKGEVLEVWLDTPGRPLYSGSIRKGDEIPLPDQSMVSI